MLNRQLMFNHVVAALIQQGTRSMGEMPTGIAEDPFFSGCAYRGADGKKCAVGHCIPDNRYKPDLENEAATQVHVMEAIDSKFGVADQRRLDDGGNGDRDFLSEMQGDLHDGIYYDDEPEKFREQLQANALDFADKYGLKVDVNLFIVPE